MFNDVDSLEKLDKIKRKLQGIQRGMEDYLEIKEVEFKFGEPNYFVGYSNFTENYFVDGERFPTMGLKYVSKEDAQNFVIIQNKLIENDKWK